MQIKHSIAIMLHTKYVKDVLINIRAWLKLVWRTLEKTKQHLSDNKD